MHKVIVKPWQVRGKRSWVVRFWENGKVKHSFHGSKSAAESEAEDLREKLDASGKTWTALPSAERQKLLLAYADAQARGVDLLALLSSSEKPQGSGPQLSVCISELLDAKRVAGRSGDYVKALGWACGALAAGREAVHIGDVSLADVESFLGSKAIESRSTLRARISTLFKFAIRKGYCLGNPCSRLETITAPRKPPAIFTPEQLAECVEWLRKRRKRALAWFVLSALCGLRPEEAEQTRKADIHLKEGWIRVEAQTSKVRQRRIVYPKPEAMRLLSSALKCSELPLASQPRRRAIRGLRKMLGWQKWPKDVTRHTAASYWLADCRSASDVAENLGHSETVLKKNYQALVTKAEAKRFWSEVAKLVSAKPCAQSPARSGTGRSK